MTTLQWTTEREPQEASPLQNEGEIEQSVDSSESMSAVSTISAVSAVSQVGIIAEPEIIPLEGISPSGQKILPLTEAELSSSSSSCSCSSSSSSRKESPARSGEFLVFCSEKYARNDVKSMKSKVEVVLHKSNGREQLVPLPELFIYSSNTVGYGCNLWVRSSRLACLTCLTCLSR